MLSCCNLQSHALYCTTSTTDTANRSHNDCPAQRRVYQLPDLSCISVNTEAHKSCSTSTTHSCARQRCDDFPKEMIRSGHQEQKKKDSGTRSPAVCLRIGDTTSTGFWQVVSFAFCPSSRFWLRQWAGFPYSDHA